MFKMVALVVTLLTLGSLGNLACAGEMVINAQFGFTAGETPLPAGKYRVETYSAKQILIRNTDTGKGVFVPILKRLGGSEDSGAMAVFSKDGNQCHLSVIYIPGMGGFQLTARRGEHNLVKLAQSLR